MSQRPDPRRIGSVSTTQSGTSSRTVSGSSASSTPAPRPGVRRLQSTKRPGPPATPVPPSAGGSGAPKPALKFKPKAVARKSKEERDQIEKTETARQQSRIAEENAIRLSAAGEPVGGHGGGGRGRGKGGRGRGGAEMGRGGMRGKGKNIKMEYAGKMHDESSDEGEAELLRTDMDHIHLVDESEEKNRAEYERYVEEVEDVKRSLGTVTMEDTQPTTSTGDGEEKPDVKVKTEAEEIKEERQGRLFLLQFPPTTPNLMDPFDQLHQGVNDIGLFSEPPTPSVKTEFGSNPGAKGKAPAVDAPPAKPTINATENQLPAGRAGKLEIHKSGRATINWGGIRFELTKGSDVTFLQDAIVMQESKATPEDEINAVNASKATQNKSVWAMSQVSGKFVISPDWENVL